MLKRNNFLSKVSSLFGGKGENELVKDSVDIHCRNCGALLNYKAKFCPQCGSKTFIDNEVISLYCPECGVVYDDVTICPSCNKLLVSLDKDVGYKTFMREYATTLVLWGYDKPRELVTNNTAPFYYFNECGITNVETFIMDLINLGLLRHPNYNELLFTLTIKELKELLKQNDISCSGNKEDLIKRIIDNNIQNSLYNNSSFYYILSDKGNAFLESHKDYIELHRKQKYMITPKEFYDVKKKLLARNSLYTFRDCIWGIFQKRLLDYSKIKEYQRLCINYENMADFCYEEGKLNVAVSLYLKSVIYDLCGLSFYNEWQWFADNSYGVETLKKNIKESPIYCRGLSSLMKCKDYFDLDMIKIEYDSLEMNFKLCSVELIEKIISEAFDDPMFDINDYKDIIVKERLNNLNKYI